MSHIHVVVLVYNRAANVRNALYSWSLQACSDFSIAVADDGSTDDIQAVIKEYDKIMPIQYYRHPHGAGPGGSRVRNKATLLAPPETTHVWYTDGDIIFNPKAMEAAYKHIEEHPNRAIAGRYDYLDRMEITPDLVRGLFDELASRITRKDHRTRGSNADWFEHKLLPTCQALLGANVIVPLIAWRECGGWDENIPGGRAFDCDFGWSLSDAGYGFLTCSCIFGHHQWHPHPSSEGTAEALRYIFPKHNEEVPDRWKEK